MADLFGTPTTTTSGLQTSLDKYYDDLLISTLDPMTRFYQFGSKRSLPKNTGDVVVWNRGLRLGVAYTLAEGYPVSAVKQISSTDVSATIEQYGKKSCRIQIFPDYLRNSLLQFHAVI